MGGVEGSIHGVISSPVGAGFERSVPRNFFKLNFDEPVFAELDGSETMDGEAIGAASTLVVDETRCGLEIMEVLIFFVDFRLGGLGGSSDTVTAEGDFSAAVAAAAWRCTSWCSFSAAAREIECGNGSRPVDGGDGEGDGESDE